MAHEWPLTATERSPPSTVWNVGSETEPCMLQQTTRESSVSEQTFEYPALTVISRRAPGADICMGRAPALLPQQKRRSSVVTAQLKSSPPATNRAGGNPSTSS